MHPHSRLARLVVLVTAVVTSQGALAAAWVPTGAAADHATERCQAMTAMHDGGTHCPPAAALTCCTSDPQPDAALPQAPPSAGPAPAQVSTLDPMPIAGAAVAFQAGLPWYARPPTHGYTTQSLLILQSVLLI
jgi:hypothetical protein